VARPSVEEVATGLAEQELSTWHPGGGVIGVSGPRLNSSTKRPDGRPDGLVVTL
jgi:hypothetical protein